MLKRLRTSLLALAAIAVLSASAGCGEAPLPTVRFVGNDTCPAGSAKPKTPSPPRVNTLPAVGQPVDEMPASKVDPPAIVRYQHDPPASGCHYLIDTQTPLKPGGYEQAVPPEYWVDNLEHGYVVVLYNCPNPPGCAADYSRLLDWYYALPPDPGGRVNYAKVLILPWPTMKPKFAVVSWDWYDPITTYESSGPKSTIAKLNMDELQRFYDNHVNQSPDGPGAP